MTPPNFPSGGLRFLACDDYARYVFNSMHCRSKCSDGCEWSVDTDMVSVAEVAAAAGSVDPAAVLFYQLNTMAAAPYTLKAK